MEAERMDSSTLEALNFFKTEPKDMEFEVGNLVDIFNMPGEWEDVNFSGGLRDPLFDFVTGDEGTRSSSFTEPSVGDNVKSASIEPPAEVSVKSEDKSVPSKSTTPRERRRRRRIRNAKQQELNRLAQQRYRERKKQKYTDLQSTVDLLAEKVEALRVLELAKNELANEKAVLNGKLKQQEQVAVTQRKQIATQQQKVASLQSVSKEHQLQITAQARKLSEQDAIIAELREKLSSTIKSACNLINADAVCEKLALAIKTALLNVKDAKSVQQALSQLELPENLLQQISQTICTCCQEMCMQLKTIPEIKPPTAIQVTCC